MSIRGQVSDLPKGIGRVVLGKPAGDRIGEHRVVLARYVCLGRRNAQKRQEERNCALCSIHATRLSRFGAVWLSYAMAALIRESRNFRLMLSGAGLTNLADGIGVVAFPWLATLITTDPRALVAFCHTAAVVSMVPAGGRLDGPFVKQRWGRRSAASP